MDFIWTDSLSHNEVEELAQLTLAIIESPASIGFLADTKLDALRQYWQQLDFSHKKLALARDDTGRAVGTIQLNLATPGNSLHRGEIAKLMVHPQAQGLGVSTTLLQAAISKARELGLSLLVLDTLSDSKAAQIYEHLGWSKAGSIPNYASLPNGELAATTFFYLELH